MTHRVRRVPLLLLVAVVALAWPPRVDADTNGYAVASWLEADGVPLGTVHAITQSGDGYLWIGADAGLFRFDGLRFTPWSALSDAPLPRAPVSALLVARDGSLWVGLADGSGVWRIRGETLIDTAPLGTLNGSVTDLAEDASRTMWAISGNALHRLAPTGWTRRSLPPADRPSLALHLYVTGQGELWVATAQGLFRRHADGDAFTSLSTGYVWDVRESRDGSVWMTDIATGFRELGEVSRSRARHKVEGGGYRLLLDRRDNLWVGTLGEGLWRVRVSASAPAAARPPERVTLPSNTVQSIFEDRDANVWVGTTAGLHRVRERPVKPVENVGFVISVAAGDGPTVWAGTTDGLVDASASRAVRPSPGGARPIVLALHRDAHETMWLGTTTGLWRIDGRQPVPVAIPPGVLRRPVTLLTSSGTTVYLGDGDDLYQWDGSTLRELTAPAQAGFGRVIFAQGTGDGRLWIASAEGRLGYLDRDGRVRTVGAEAGLPDGTHTAINAIVEDAGSLWIAGSGGLSRLAGDRVATVTRAQGLPGSRVASVVADGAGYLWLSVDRGVARLHRDEVSKAVADPSYRMRYTLLDTSDGLAGAPLGSIRSARGADGTLWFVRGGGLSTIDPRSVPRDSSPPAAVQIEAVAANERRLPSDHRAALPPGTKRLQISYTALALSSPDDLRFRYRLEGFDTDWIEAGTRRSAFYTNLAPRRYTFRVEAHTEDGTWRQSAATWTFTIEPAFYQTRTFYAICATVPLLAGWAAWRLRLRLIRRRFSLVIAERSRMSREIHDTLLQSLVAVTLELDAVGRTVDTSVADAKSELRRIRRQVEVHIRDVRHSIWHLRSPMLDTQDLCKVLREFGTRLVADRNVRFTATVSGPSRRCSARTERQILRIGQEAITNAVRHAAAGAIDVELRFTRDAVHLTVSDDGRGFEPQRVAGGPDGHYGLTTMRERAEEAGGRFSLRTAIGRGTIVEVVLPLQDDGAGGHQAVAPSDRPGPDDGATSMRRAGLTPPPAS